eukprot:scaffold46073_cov33-Tisochrysis_lutea.AAC.1
MIGSWSWGARRSPPPPTHPAATDKRAMLDATQSNRPREGTPPAQVRTRHVPCHSRTAEH